MSDPERRMLFSINYSHPAAELYAAGKLPLDRFKTPGWPDMIAEATRLLPVAVHTELKAGCGKMHKVDWEQTAALLQQTQTPYINVHLESKTGSFPDIPQDSDDPDHRRRLLGQMLEDLQQVIERFGRERVIAENTPYRPGSKLIRISAEPQVIREVIEATGVGLLLDISHARISAHHLGMDWREYVSQLPVDRLRELHFTGIEQRDGWLQDHRPALPEDWQALDWVLERIRLGEWPVPWMMAFEYGGVGGKFTENSDPQVIEEQGNILIRAVRELRD